jgi:hypothetical protein
MTRRFRRDVHRRSAEVIGAWLVLADGCVGEC